MFHLSFLQVCSIIFKTNTTEPMLFRFRHELWFDFGFQVCVYFSIYFLPCQLLFFLYVTNSNIPDFNLGKTLIMIFVYYVENNNRTEEIDTGIILHNKKDLKLIVRCICILLPFPYFNHHYHHFLCIHSVFQCFNVFNIF